MAPRALIAGLGLIGGSIALRLRSRGWRVAYVDPFVDTATFDRRDTLDDADVIVLATPVDAAIEIARTVDTDAVVTTVCSVMKPLRDIARGRFVAGHPIAGSEKSGFAAATETLFEGKRWFVDADDPIVDQMIADCGAIRERVSAEEHDAAVALTSHLPQVLSTALAAYLDGREDLLRFAGTGLRTFLRLAGSDASVWRPVLEANRENIPVDEVLKIAQAIVDGDSEAFAKAQRFFGRL